MDKQEYMEKAKDLLEQPTYRPLPADTTTKYKAKLIYILKRIKTELSMDDNMYSRRYIQPECVLPSPLIFQEFIKRTPMKAHCF